ncbi:TPA: YitT family protein [Bacillus cereus]|uniref:YitT family protein n=1 Tax=Bacillus TaxID=1386 RepID=UPI00112497C1|nr:MULTISPECIES: YitT family protein [Bacillus]MCP1179615.1 YitT family protein [Bacillus sp. 1663tsa1]MCP1284871.1 YitT family protein [Bacillus sp. S0635]MCQ6347818.1 YitT family protein [Bacillus cereus]MCU5750141.1 YitT family protein [Bacillus cereus]HDX9627544.1 YitT family protein [Bacillus cereus]
MNFLVKDGKEMVRFLGVIIGSIIIAIAFNLFLIPHKILSSGIGGIAIILGIVTPVNTGIINFVLNLPILILGYIGLGKKVIFNTVISVIVLSVALYYVPVKVVATDALLSSIFGGVIAGAGIGLVFNCNGSTGGFDIIGMLLSRKRDIKLGGFLIILNAVVVIIAGFFFTWDVALTSLLSIYVTGKVIDAIHTKHRKVTLMIVTNEAEKMKKQLLSTVVRGITLLDGEGAYSSEKKRVLMTVVSREELASMKLTISEIDPHAFVNITETVEVLGLFRKA